MRRKQLFVFCVVLALSFAVFPVLAQEQPSGEKMELTLKFQKGQKLEYVLYTGNTTTTQNVQGMGEMKHGTTMETGVVQEVTEVDEKGAATVQTKYSYIKLKMDNMGNTVKFDSTNKEEFERAKNDKNLKLFVAMLEKPFSFKIDRKGTVLEVKGFAAMMQEVFKDESSAEAMMLKSMFSDEALQKTFQNYYPFLPKEKVGKGDSWTTTIEMPMGPMGTVKIDYKFTFEGMEKLGERQCAKIKDELTKFSLEGGMMAGMFSISKHEGSGTTYFDPANGILVKSEMKMSFTTKMPNPGDPNKPSMEMVTETAYSMALKEIAKEEPKKEEEKK